MPGSWADEQRDLYDRRIRADNAGCAVVVLVALLGLCILAFALWVGATCA